ncbi:MAG TPA: hypothetical protein VJW94_02705 [Candidatus Acidoferrum sp.]|nr:hypothetical protein [Candidatus Acidoferrum sp.]
MAAPLLWVAYRLRFCFLQSAGHSALVFLLTTRRPLFSFAQKGSHDAGTTAAMENGEDNERFFIRRLSDEKIFHGMKTKGARRAERFLSSQADTFASANVKGKGVGLLRSK